MIQTETLLTFVDNFNCITYVKSIREKSVRANKCYLNSSTDLPPVPLAGREVLVLFLLSDWSDRANGLTLVLQL